MKTYSKIARFIKIVTFRSGLIVIFHIFALIYSPKIKAMKKLLLILLITLPYFTLFGQSYLSLLDNGNVWHSYFNGYSANNNTITIEKDTFINGFTYKKLNQATYFFDGNTNTTTFYLREFNDKVEYLYLYSTNNFNSKILYDFSAQVGNFIGLIENDYNQPDSAFLLQIDSVFIDTSYRKRWNIGFAGGFVTARWIEGIGSTNGLGNPIQHTSTTYGGASSLLCFNNLNTTIYMDSNYNTCFVSTGIENKYLIPNDVFISPNPISNKGVLKFNGNTNKRIDVLIYNVLGQIVLQEELDSNNELILDKNKLSSGLYIYHLVAGNMTITKGKFLIK